MVKLIKPGCFESVLSYSSSDPACIACAFNSECGEGAYSSLLTLREEMDVSELEKRFNITRIKAGKAVVNVKAQSAEKLTKRDRLTPWQREIVEDGSLPVKPRKLIGAIFRKGYDGEFLLSAAMSGINPFMDQKPAILDKAFSMLIELGTFSKAELHRTYMEMGMAKRTAHSQVSIVVATLEILGVVKVNRRSELVHLKGEQ